MMPNIQPMYNGQASEFVLLNPETVLGITDHKLNAYWEQADKLHQVPKGDLQPQRR